MSTPPAAKRSSTWLIEQETRALLARLRRVRPFALSETTTAAAALFPAAQLAIEQLLLRGRAELAQEANDFLRWLRGAGRTVDPAEQQRRFSVLKLRFVDQLAQLDLFSEAVTQRSEHETGVWLAGLDVAANDGLTLPGGHFEVPPVICYLGRGTGAAIRRARTRLPGDAQSPIALVRIPRERMVGHGIASSLMHEVGHQGAALLDLVASVRSALDLRRQRARTESERRAWLCWRTWISEILADFWSVSRLGVGSTLGLIGVVSLPRRFVFRFTLSDPHPFPWIRVVVSTAIGQRLYPDPQWAVLRDHWRRLYPTAGVDDRLALTIQLLERTIEELITIIGDNRPAALGGETLSASLCSGEARPARLRHLAASTKLQLPNLLGTPPVVALAALGQARWDGLVTPEAESRLVGQLLNHWALHSTLAAAAACATLPLPVGRGAGSATGLPRLRTEPPSAGGLLLPAHLALSHP